MQAFRKILVGLELEADESAISPGARKALLQAHWIATRTGASLKLLHSSFNETYVDHVEGGRPILRQGVTAEGGATLEAALEETRAAGVEADLVVVPDRPWLEMIRSVLRAEADLVVVGMRNHPTFMGRPIGGQSMRLLRQCPAPVWVVHPEHELVHRLVLAATDLTPVGALVCQLGAYVADAQGAELHLVHAYQIPMELQLSAARMSDEEYVEQLRKIESRAREAMKDSLADSAFTGEPHLHVGKSSPAIAVTELVKQLDPDLVVMGTLSRTGVAGMLVGNTAERLLGELDCSLLTVKPEGFVSPVTL